VSIGLSVADRLLLAELKAKFPELERRVEALEKAQVATRRPLADQAAANRAAREALYAEVRSILEQHQGPERLTGKHVLNRLAREPKPSLRQVQDHMKRARVELAVPPQRDALGAAAPDQIS
jgi:hypothetical protein